MSEEKQYVVAWELKKGNKKGVGKKLLSKYVADAWVKELNDKHPDLIHKAVEVNQNGYI